MMEREAGREEGRGRGRGERKREGRGVRGRWIPASVFILFFLNIQKNYLTLRLQSAAGENLELLST